MWCAWYSEKQRRMVGYATYLGKKGSAVWVTEVSRDPDHRPSFPGSEKVGRVTHFVQVEERNHNKHPKHAMHPSHVEHDVSNHGAWLITN